MALATNKASVSLVSQPLLLHILVSLFQFDVGESPSNRCTPEVGFPTYTGSPNHKLTSIESVMFVCVPQSPQLEKSYSLFAPATGQLTNETLKPGMGALVTSVLSASYVINRFRVSSCSPMDRLTICDPPIEFVSQMFFNSRVARTVMIASIGVVI